MGTYVIERFRRELILHVAKNYLHSEFDHISSPLVMAIHGSPGNGKTSQIVEVCGRHEIELIRVSSSTLSGKFEGDSSDKFLNYYQEAVITQEQTGRCVVLLLEDFDTGLATIRDGVEHTANSYLLAGLMMNLADDPSSYCNHGNSRVPIIVTGNDLSATYAPLLRTGRAKMFLWEPSREEKELVVSHMINPSASSDASRMARQLVSKHSSEPLSFFADYLSTKYDKHIWSGVQSLGSINPAELQAAAKRLSGLHRLASVSRGPKAVVRSLGENKLRSLYEKRKGRPG